MVCNFVKDAITYIWYKKFNDLRQHNSDSHFIVRVCPFLLPAFASLLLLQELREIMRSQQTIKSAIYRSVHSGIIHV
jgi:hypothetical protein